MDRIQLAVQVAGPARTETLMGHEYRVFPAVLVREQVLRNNLGATFLPREEIEASAEAWNGIPVVVRHPTSRGAPVSARQPEILNTRGVGFLFRARAENGELKADVYVDTARAADVEDAANVVNQVDRGEAGELSTGFATTLERTPGTFRGEAYDVVLRDIRPDHLALLPDEVGACSVEDGCGLGVNCRCGGNCGATNDDVPAPPQGVSPEKVANDSAWRRFLGTAARVLGFRPAAQNESDEDRRNMLASALRERFGGEGRFVFVVSVDSENDFVVWEIEVEGGSDGAGLFRADFEIAEDGSVSIGEPVQVRRVTTFEPVANEAGEFRQEEKIMDRQQMIAHLAEAGRDRDVLAKLSDADLQALCGASGGSGSGSEGAQNRGDDSEAWRLAHEYRRKYEELDAQTRNARQAEEKERAGLLDDLIYNARSLPWGEEELKGMEIGELRKIHAAVFPAREDYSGRGGPRASNVGRFDFVRPIMDGHRGESVLDREEVA